MRVLAVYSSMSATRAVVTQTDAKTVINSMALFATPHALLRHMCLSLSDAILDRCADFTDLCLGERRGDMKGQVNVTLNASESISSGKAS